MRYQVLRVDLMKYLGPFELTKLSAQVSVLMADRQGSVAEPRTSVAASYQNKGISNPTPCSASEIPTSTKTHVFIKYL